MTSSRGSSPESTASASFGPIPLIAISRSKTVCSSGVAKPKSASLILADVRVDAQRDLGAGFAGDVKRRQRHRDVVAHTADIDDDAIGMLLENAPAQERDHAGRMWLVGAPG